jgi:DNA invertase Pin-like site-specific DNA recombinase
VENVSRAKLDRSALFKLLDASHLGDVLLIEGVDRLSRLIPDDWKMLKTLIEAKKVTVVSIDLSTSHEALKSSHGMNDFTKGMITAVNGILLNMLAVIARKNYEDRRPDRLKASRRQRLMVRTREGLLTWTCTGVLLSCWPMARVFGRSPSF